MKLNRSVFVKMIDMLLSRKILKGEFNFQSLGAQGCGCTIFHAEKLGILDENNSNDSKTIGLSYEDFDCLFGFGQINRELVFDQDRPTKQEVAQVMEDYLTAVEMGMVPGVE